MSQQVNIPFPPHPNIQQPLTNLKTSSGNVVLDFYEADNQQVTLTGNATLAPVNATHAGLSKAIFVTGGGSSYTLTLPASWVPLGGLTSPITVAAGKCGILSVAVVGTNDASANTTQQVWASWIVQS